MSEHAILQPSSAHRWVNCPGSVQAEQKYPDVESDSSREGTAAHWVAEQVIASYQSESVLAAPQFIDQVAPNGVVITDEMIEGAQLYINDVLIRCQAEGLLAAMRVEHRVMIGRVHPENWGTDDCDIYDKNNGILTLWDFKYGRVAVECWENWQLIEYGIGVLDEVTGGNGISDQHIKVEMRIVQPRAFHVEGTVRAWTVQGSDLRNYANQLKTSAGKALQPDPPCKAGTWCENCSASRGCMTLQREDARIADRVEVLQLHDLSPADAAVELRYLQRAKVLLDERLGAHETQSLQQIKNGVDIPGFGIGTGRGSTKWDKPGAEVIALGDLLGIELRKPEAPITPTQAMKLNVDEAVIKSYSKKYDGAARLVTIEDTIASRIFKNNEPE